MNLSEFSSVMAIVAVPVAIGIAIWQNRVAKRQRKRAADLEEHLGRLRWQQLRSTADVITSLERDGRYVRNAEYAAARAKLVAQYSQMLGTITGEESSFEASSIKHWIEVGRLTQPWQITEAMIHLPSTESGTEAFKWIQDKLSDQAPGMIVEATVPPRAFTQLEATYVLLLWKYEAVVRTRVKAAGTEGYSTVVAIHGMAGDIINYVTFDSTMGNPRFQSWGFRRKSIDEILEYYGKQDYSTVCSASYHCLTELPSEQHFAEYRRLVPTPDAVDKAREEHPQLAAAVDAHIQPDASKNNLGD